MTTLYYKRAERIAQRAFWSEFILRPTDLDKYARNVPTDRVLASSRRYKQAYQKIVPGMCAGGDSKPSIEKK